MTLNVIVVSDRILKYFRFWYVFKIRGESYKQFPLGVFSHLSIGHWRMICFKEILETPRIHEIGNKNYPAPKNFRFGAVFVYIF